MISNFLVLLVLLGISIVVMIIVSVMIKAATLSEPRGKGSSLFSAHCCRFVYQGPLRASLTDLGNNSCKQFMV